MHIAEKLLKKVASGDELKSGITSGIMNAAATLIRTTYETVSERLPPSLLVTTPAAAAVGQTKQSIAHSARIFPVPSGRITATQANTTNSTTWIARATRCHRRNLRSCGEILLNWRKSMMAISTGWIFLANAEKPGSTFSANSGTR